MTTKCSETSNSKSLKCVVLFDVDGTLVTGPTDGPSAGLLAMAEATRLVTGVDILGDPSSYIGKSDQEIAEEATDKIEDARRFAGRTDFHIARALLALFEENPSQKKIDQLVDNYITSFEYHISKKPYTLLGDPAASIKILEEKGAIVGLGTGNIRQGAFLKLKSAGIDHLFNFDKGGYGEDGVVRKQLLRIGVRRCDPTLKLPVIVIGDTPHDVEGAHQIGAKCIGIPHDYNTAEVLRNSGADGIVNIIDTNLHSAIESLL